MFWNLCTKIEMKILKLNIIRLVTYLYLIVDDLQRSFVFLSLKLPYVNWTQELKLRKAQIADLQNKCIDEDTSNKKRWDNIQSMVEAKAAMAFLFETAAEGKVWGPFFWQFFCFGNICWSRLGFCLFNDLNFPNKPWCLLRDHTIYVCKFKRCLCNCLVWK